jgi:hypothetical protein
MTWYSKADDDLNRTIQSVMSKYHKPLIDAGVSIDCLVARCEDEHPIKVRGLPALGTIKITGIRDRSLGLGDAIMTIDGEAMPSWNERRLQSLIDHELNHLELVINKKTGEVKRDDLDRPKLKIRLHDHEFGWFDLTARRFGNDSIEVSQAQGLIECARWIQEFLPGLAEVA